MSNALSSTPEEPKRIVEIDFSTVPKILKLSSYRQSPDILQPEKIKLFEMLFDDLYRYCEGLEGEFVLNRGRDYAIYFQMMFEFARPKMQDMYEQHGPDLERMIMHVSRNMIDDKKKFLPFFLLQMFMLEKGTKRNIPLTRRLLAAEKMEEVDLEEVHRNLRQDAQNLFFLSSSFSCTFIEPHPNNVLIGANIGTKPKYIGTRRTWDTKKMIARAVPEYDICADLQEQLDRHIDYVLTKDDKTVGAMFYFLMNLLPTDMPEIMAFMGNFVTFDIPDSDNPNEKYLVTIDRKIEKREMDFFKSLLAAHELVCYGGIIKIFSTTPYLYLWRQLLSENPEMRKNVESRPLSPEGRFFRELFDQDDIAFMVKPESESLQGAARKKYILPRNFHTFTDVDFENKRAEVNARITDIMNGKIKIADSQKEIQRLNAYVIELSHHIAARVSSVWMDGFLSSQEIQEQQKEVQDTLHRQKRIEIDTTLIGLELYDREQPRHIDFSLLLEAGYPEGTLISVSRKMPVEKEEILYENIVLPSDGIVPVEPGVLKHNGKIQYRVTFTAPLGREFEPNVTTRSVILETHRLNKPAEALVASPKLPEMTAEALEAQSLATTFAILQTYVSDYERTGKYDNGRVTLELDERHISDKKKVVSQHKKWTITDVDEVSPILDEGSLRSLIIGLAAKIRARVKQEEEEKMEQNKEAQSFTVALMVLSEYRDFYEQEGGYDKGIVTVQLEDEHVQGILSIVGEEGSEIRDHHRTWTITDTSEISPSLAGEERVTLLSLAEKIRARVKQEEADEKEKEKLKFIDSIDAEFQTLGFTLSDALETGDLRKELERKITSFRAKNQDETAVWDKEIDRLSAVCREKGYLFYRSNCKNGFPEAITFGKRGGWLAILELQPVLKFKLNNPPQENAQIFRQRIENALMTFAYDIIKNGNHTVESLARETRAKEDLTKLRKHYKKDLKRRKARILAQTVGGQFTIIRDISRDNLEDALIRAQAEYGEGNVALLLREATYHFHGEHGIIRPAIDKIRLTYEDFNGKEVGLERRAILRERVIRTLFNGRVLGATKREGFIPGSGVDQVLSDVKATFTTKKGSQLIEDDIDDRFMTAFINSLRKGDAPVPVSYIDHRVAYCRVEDIGELIAD